MANNGIGWKVAFVLLAVLIGIVTTWTGATSQEVKTIKERQTATEENVRTIHYEAKTQRLLMKRIAKKLDVDVSDIPDVRPLREAE